MLYYMFQIRIYVYIRKSPLKSDFSSSAEIFIYNIFQES